MNKTLNEAQKIYRSLIGDDETPEDTSNLDPFAGLFDDISDIEAPFEETLNELPTDEPSIIEEETTAPVVEPIAKVEPTVPVVEPTVVEEVPATVEPVVAPVAPVDEAEIMKQLHEGFAKQYQLDEETADQFLTDPAVALPKLAAQLHVNILSQVMQLIQNSLPQQITQVQETAAKRQTIETQFKQAWPDLDLAKPDISEVVTEASRLAKQRYPKADMPELIQKTGLIAHALMGTVGVGQAPTAAPAAPTASPKPVSPTPSRHIAVPATPASKNEWESLLDDIQGE